MIKIRMARGGRVHKPVYTLVAAESKKARDGKFLEKLGQYDPSAKKVLNSLKIDRIQYWVSKGAILSDTVRTLLKNEKVALN
ncbi:MAG: 30S ribosomal protein S16 [Bacteriovoracaceae bacterium]|jgi:small subunit ribosomal protein S16|nr:30S ribosomal protein S16 [Bacteriovoracaceae bacterium]